MKTDELLTFTKNILLPKANSILSQTYRDYCQGQDIEIVTKADQSPATQADRMTESALRELISENYPLHGIHGEEFGGHNLDSDWIWVLDPLDGTKEFVAQKKGQFGTLIGLLYKGKAVLGAMSDPINNQQWFSGQVMQRINNRLELSESTIACTRPCEMFPTHELQNKMSHVEETAHAIKTDLNCLGFAGVIDGLFDAVIENQLKAHDLLPLIPILLNAGLQVVDLSGNSYACMEFASAEAFERKYGVIAASNPTLMEQILSCFNP